MSDVSAILDESIDYFGGPTVPAPDKEKCAVVVRFANPSFIPLFEERFQGNFIQPMERVAGRVLIGLCDDVEYAREVAKRLKAIMDRADYNHLDTPFHKNWLEDRQVNRKMGISGIYLSYDEDELQDRMKQLKSQLTESCRDHSLADSLREELASSHTNDIIQSWYDDLVEHFPELSKATDLKSNLAHISHFVVTSANKSGFVFMHKVGPMAMDVVRKVMAYDKVPESVDQAKAEGHVLNAYFEKKNAYRAHLSLSADALTHIHEIAGYLQSFLAERPAKDSQFELGPESVRNLDLLARKSLISYSGRLEKTLVGQIIQAFAFHVACARIAYRTDLVESRIRRFAKNMDEYSNIRGFTALLDDSFSNLLND